MMTSIFRRCAVKAETALLPLALFSLVLADNVLAEGASGPAYDCRALTESAERLACYDDIFGAPRVNQVAAVDSPQASGAVAQEVVGTDALVRERIEREQRLFEYPFAIIPHKPSYILPYTNNAKPNNAPYSPLAELSAGDQRLDNAEAKFQISIKVPLAQDFLVEGSTLWAGYTQLSLWQVYNSEASAPFRETNYEPEIFWTFDTGGEWAGLPLQGFSLGFTHQSNGRGELLSRSWNRIYADFLLADDNWAVGFKPWYRIPEDEENDDNPDIADYLGYADFTFAYKWEDMTFTTLLRNNLRSEDNLTSGNITMSFPLPGRLNGYVEYVNGYGETLIDYNHRNQRIGIGVVLNDWY